MEISNIVLMVTIILSGLMAGFFYAYTFSVNPGLHNLTDTEFLKAMKNINKEVLNPVFFICFFGTLVLLFVSAILNFNLQSTKFYFIVAAFFTYLIGVFMITGMRNVPLNNQLAAFNIEQASNITLQQMRNIFEKPWVYWNNIRTFASLLTLVFLILSLMMSSNGYTIKN